MDAKIVKDTQDTLGKIIKKPPLTEKLLTKPPFRFLHDIMTSVIKTTGLMQGLFTDDEMNSENVKDKESKMAFLQKVIDIVSLINGKQLHVKTSKIVAGHEAEKTNLLLQSLAESINKNVNNDSYVQKVLGRHKNGDDRGKENSSEKRKGNEKTETVENKTEKRPSTKKDSPDERIGERHGSREREGSRHRDASNEKGGKKDSGERESSRGRGDDRVKGDEKVKGDGEGERGEGREREHRSSRKVAPVSQNTSKPAVAKTASKQKTDLPAEKTEKPSIRVRETPKPTQGNNTPKSNPTAAASSSTPTIRQKNSATLLRAPVDPRKKSLVKKSASDAVTKPGEEKSPRGQNSRVQSRQTKHRKEKEDAPPGDVLKKEQPLSREDIQQDEQPVVNGNREDTNDITPSNRKMERPSSAKGSRRRRDGRGATTVENTQEEVVVKKLQEETEAKNMRSDDVQLAPQVIESRSMLRPSSARPAPPQVKKQDVVSDEPAMRLGSGRPTHVIVDNDQSDEDEFFLVEETKALITEPDSVQKLQTEEDLEQGDHGGLVKKILETKKELEAGSQQTTKKTEIERPAITDAARRKERDIVQKEVDKLRGCIQGLTRSANPLGKIMDYVQEDLDAMHVELREWQEENKQHGLSLKYEQGITNKAVEPLKVHLIELDNTIADQLDKIIAVKSNICANDKKIDKMLRSINKS